jgi:hypothetical protein
MNTADEVWSTEETVAELGRLESALLALAASWYEIRGKAAQDGTDPKDKRVQALDAVATHFARCARKCRDARLALGSAEQRGTGKERASPRLVAL